MKFYSEHRGLNKGKGFFINFLILMLIVVLLSACGSTSVNHGNNASNVDETGQTEPAANNVNEEGSQQNETKVVVHELGETEIPVNPQRVVSINLEDMLYSLEIPLVLATPIQRQDYMNAALEEKGTQIVSDTGELNYEAIMSSNPDLIVMSMFYGEEVYTQLTKIAPTIAYNRTDWRSSIVEIGDVLNAGEKAQQILEQQQSIIDQAKQELTQIVGPDPVVAFLRMQEKDLRLFYPTILSNPNPFAGYVSIAFEGLGWKSDPFVLELQSGDQDKQNASVSLEVLPNITAEHLFVVTLSDDGSDKALQRTLDELLLLEDSAIWSSISAVKEKKVHLLNMKSWLIDGPIAEQNKLKDLLRSLSSSEG